MLSRAEELDEKLTRLRRCLGEDQAVHLRGIGAAGALLARGLQPALILVVGKRRLPLHRHPLPTTEPWPHVLVNGRAAAGSER